MDNYTFITHPIEKLHQIIPDILPGIEKIITVHYDEAKSLIIGKLTEKNNHQYVTRHLNLDKILPTLHRFMEEKNPYDWYNRKNLPFEVEIKASEHRINIFSELQNIVLLIRVPDTKQELNDLIFLYLNENPSNFGVTNSINPLTTDNKSIIAFVLNNTIRTFFSLQNSDKSILKSYNQRTRQIIGQTESLKSEMQRTKENYGISLVKLCQQIMKEQAAVNGKNYRLSAGALDKIKNYKGEIKDLEAIIIEALAYADSLYVDHSDDIDILEWHIVFDVPMKKEVEKVRVDHQSDKYSKTLTLLNKLESAALTIKSQQLKLTGTNVGSAFPERISAPAISDALYNHKSKINSLLKMYPDKWETIRKDFRPLKNILSPEKQEIN
jgi:hypothetical protein